MRKLRPAIAAIFCLLATLFASAAPINVRYDFADFLNRPLNVKLVTVTPLAKGADYDGQTLATTPLRYPVSTYWMLTNGTLTVSNLLAGYAYQVAFSDSFATYLMTNYFASDLVNTTNGTVNGEFYRGVILNQRGGIVYQFAFYNQTNTFGWEQNFITTNSSIVLSNIIQSMSQGSATNAISIAAGSRVTVITNSPTLVTVSADVQTNAVLANLALTGAITNVVAGSNATVQIVGGTATVNSTASGGGGDPNGITTNWSLVILGDSTNTFSFSQGSLTNVTSTGGPPATPGSYVPTVSGNATNLIIWGDVEFMGGNAFFSTDEDGVNAGGNWTFVNPPFGNGSLWTALAGANITLGTINSNKLDAATVAMFGAGGGGGTTYTNSTDLAGKIVGSGIGSNTTTFALSASLGTAAYSNSASFQNASTMLSNIVNGVDTIATNIGIIFTTNGTSGIALYWIGSAAIWQTWPGGAPLMSITNNGVFVYSNLVASLSNAYNGSFIGNGSGITNTAFLTNLDSRSLTFLGNYMQWPGVTNTGSGGSAFPAFTEARLSFNKIEAGDPATPVRSFNGGFLQGATVDTITMTLDSGTNDLVLASGRSIALSTTNVITFTSPSNYFTGHVRADGTFYGDGRGLTNLHGTNLIAGTVNSNRLDAATLAMFGGGGGTSNDWVGSFTGNMTGGTNYAASNIISGGVIPPGTVSASTATAGYVLATDGALRQWTNRVTLVQIDGQVLYTSFVRVTNTTAANFYTDIGINGAITNVNPNGGGVVMLTNAAAAGTYTFMQSPSNGANVTVFGIVSNSVSRFSITSFGTVNTATSATFGGGVTGATLTGNGAVQAGTVFTIATNYTAANFVPVAGQARIVSSNGALYKVTQVSTNLISPE